MRSRVFKGVLKRCFNSPLHSRTLAALLRIYRKGMIRGLSMGYIESSPSHRHHAAGTRLQPIHVLLQTNEIEAAAA
jgi:hypothetical protein